ncbi:MAG TPA: hypothetical protein VIG77_03855 [Ktedonobacterales bacterium]|jgi:hypothetical protein
MIERLQRALEHIEELSPEAQQELAEQIEALSAPIADLPSQPTSSDDEALPRSVRVALALGGAWSDLHDDDEFAFFDRIRHETPPTPPMDEQLAWLEDEQ